MNVKTKVTLILALVVLLLSLMCVPTKASIGKTSGVIGPGPLDNPECSCDYYPTECYC